MPIRVAVIGAGSMGMNHVRVLRELEDAAELVGVADVDAEALARATRRFHVDGYADYRELLQRTKPALVTVVVPTQLHAEVADYALSRGINVLVEKPIAATPEEAQRLIDLARKHGVKLAVGHVERFNPAIVELKHQLVSGRLGQIFYLHSRRLGPFPARIRDVGVILDLATHDLDIMRYLVDSEVKHLIAETQQHVHRTCEDLLLGMVHFVNDTVGMLDVNWLTPTKMRELTVTGERGMFHVNYLTQDLYFFENDYTATDWDTLRTLNGVSEGTMTRLKLQKTEPLRLEYEDVLRAITCDMAPTVTGEDGLAVLRISHRLLDASQTCKVVGPVRRVVHEPVA